MSIIQEALKKIEPADNIGPGMENTPAEQVFPNEVRRPEPVPAHRPRRTAVQLRPQKLPRITIIIAISVFLLCLFGIGLFLISHKTPAKSPYSDSQKTDVSETPKAAYQDTIYKTIDGVDANKDGTASSPDSVVRTEPPDLVLNGIMYLETGARAIINNNIVREGDMVGGATVTFINKKSVILKYNNVEITLNLK